MDILIPYYEDNSRISNSSLGWFLQSPRYFRDRLDGKVEEKPTSAMENGTMVHMYLLQPEEFKKTYKVLSFQTPTSQQQKKFCEDYIASTKNRPILKALEAFKNNYSTTGRSEEDNGKKGLEMALKLKHYIKFLRENKNGTKVISWAELETLKKIKENVLLHKTARELLLNNPNSANFKAENEFHINWEWITYKDAFTEDKLLCKSLIDRIVIDHDNKVIKLIDIKTTVSVANFSNSFKEYDYGRQMSFYWFAIRWYLEVDQKIDLSDYTAETYIVAIQNNRGGECRVYRVGESILVEKAKEIKNILSEIDWHKKENLWDFSKEYYQGDGTESLKYD